MTIGDQPIDYLKQLHVAHTLTADGGKPSPANGSITSDTVSDTSDASRINDSIVTNVTLNSVTNNVSVVLLPSTSNLFTNGCSKSLPNIATTLFLFGDFKGSLFRDLLQHTQCVIGLSALKYYFREKIVSFTQ